MTVVLLGSILHICSVFVQVNEKGQVVAKSVLLKELGSLEEETGLKCCICLEGYRSHPQKVCVCVCVRVCMRACMRACVCMHVCVCEDSDDSCICQSNDLFSLRAVSDYHPC